MRPYFSEFSYAFALTYELVNQTGISLVGFPMFPSLIQEGSPDGGYDLRLPIVGAPIYLQFKRSHYLRTSRAMEWSLFNAPYYRFYLRSGRYSQQHRLLLDLESDPSEPKIVLYAAPMFYTEEQLASYFLRTNTINNSAFFSPSDIGQLPDYLEHYVVFNERSSNAYVCSEPKKIDSYTGQKFMKYFQKLIHEHKKKIDSEYFLRLTELLVSILKDARVQVDLEKLKHKVKIESDEHVYIRLSTYILRVYFGTEMFVARP
jgi:hypothetical protein